MKFLKGVSPGIFFQKSNFFLWAFFTETISENIVFDIVEEKNDCKRNKKKF